MQRIVYNKKQGGYSLPQMLTATAVGAVLTGVATTNYWSAVDKSRITAELETFDRINEAVNVVLAADEGNTTFLTEEHRKLFQKIIPETGSELTYAIRSAWKGNDDTEGNHQYALSLDVYPRYSGINAYESATLKSSLSKEAVNGETYYLAGQFSKGIVPGTSGYTADPNSSYAVSVKDTSGKYFVLKQDQPSSVSLVQGASVDANKFDTLVYDGVKESSLNVNPSGVQKIGLLAQALDRKVDGGSEGTEGRVQYDDTCTSGADNCYMHIYLVDRGFSYNEQGSGGNSWHDEFFVQNFKSGSPKSTVVRSGQKQSTVILGKNGDS